MGLRNPHDWLFGSGLVFLPIQAIVLARRRQGETAGNGLSNPMAWG